MFSFKSYITEAKEYILWGLPKGKTDPLYQEILSTQSKTPAQVEEVKRRAAKEGWHSFRVQILDISQPFEWNAKKMVKEATEHLYEVPRGAPKHPITIVDYILDGAVLKTYRYMTLVGTHLKHIKNWLAAGSLPDGTAPYGEKRAVKINGKLKTFKKI